MGYILTILGFIILPLAESFFQSMNLISIFFVLVMYIFLERSQRNLYVILIVCSIILDIIFNLNMGTYLLVTSISLILFQAFTKFVPSENVVSRVGLNIFIFAIFSFLYAVANYIQFSLSSELVTLSTLSIHIFKGVQGALLLSALSWILGQTVVEKKNNLKFK